MNGKRQRSMGLLAAIGAAGVLAAACGGSSSGGPATAKVAATGGSSSAPAASATTITTHSGPLGTYLTDGSGRTVYLFTPDSATASKCSGACLGLWPPVTTSGMPTGSDGVAASKLGTLTRSDGSTQVTYAGHPLYYFSKDSAAGDTNGEGINNFGGGWFAVSPAGAKIAPKASSSPTSSGGGYSNGWG